MSRGVKECPSCALDVDRDEHPEVCPYCGYEYPKQKPTTKATAALFVVLMLLFVFYSAC